MRRFIIALLVTLGAVAPIVAMEGAATARQPVVQGKHLPGDWFVGYIGGYPSYCFQGYYLPTVYSTCKAYQMRTSFGYHQHRWGTIQRLPSSYAFYPDSVGWFAA